MNLSLKAARGAQAAHAVQAKQLSSQERDEKLSECRVRSQISKSPGYKAICEYAENVREGIVHTCVGTNPTTEPTAIARAQGAHQFIEGMRRYFEGADREAAEIESQTAG